WERFRELFEEEHAAGCRLATRRNYERAFDLFEKLANPGQLRSITGRTLSAFKAALQKEPGRANPTMRPSTVRGRLQFLHTALAWAVEQKLLPEVPTFPEVKVPLKSPQPVPEEAFERLMAKAPDKAMRVFMLCGWLAGLRLGEAVALEWEENDKAPWVD